MIPTYLNLKKVKLSFIITAVLFGCLLCTNYIFAVNYTVYGQVFQVSSEEAANNNIDYTIKLPYVHVAIYNRANGALLGEGDAGNNGQYSVAFTGSSPLAVDCRVYKIINGASPLLQEAQAGINQIDISSNNILYYQKKLLVICDEPSYYGNQGFTNTPGTGIVFTRVGLVEIPYISQIPTDPKAGLADFVSVNGGPARALELHIPVFENAPFGGNLLIYGDFGIPSSNSNGSKIDWYQVNIRKYDGTDFIDTINLMDPLSKTKTVVQTAPVFKVTNTSEKMGPFTGEDYIDTNTEYLGVYKVNKNNVTGSNATFYSFPDLRINWNTTPYNGLYEISLDYFQEMPGGTPEHPMLKKLDNVCGGNNCQTLILKINNEPLTVTFDHIYLKNESSSLYFQASGPDGPIGTALDFNQEGLCNIMKLSNTYKVEIHFTAHHAGGYMKNYSLSARSNNGSPVNFNANPLEITHFNYEVIWEGATGKIFFNLTNFPCACGYIFSLDGWSRVQDGVHYIQHANPLKTYYVIPN